MKRVQATRFNKPRSSYIQCVDTRVTYGGLNVSEANRHATFSLLSRQLALFLVQTGRPLHFNRAQEARQLSEMFGDAPRFVAGQ
jgi:hypothetical protein